MVDFMIISERRKKHGDEIWTEIYPRFIVKKSSDLMIRGGDFYAIWLEQNKLWSTEEQDAIRLIDSELDKYVSENKRRLGECRVLHMWDSETGMIDKWHKYCQRHLRDNFHMLDESIIFSNAITTKEDYASKKLPYPLEKGSIDAYDMLISTLYSPEERHKIEWSIGSIVEGSSKTIQKFVVLYGAAGTGKSTILNIIEQLFSGYCAVFDAKALASSSNQFALEAFKTNPLVAIQHDGDLSKIEDNTRLNSLVSHELMTVNEKFKSSYSSSFKAFLFMGTNKPVKITDAKSGLIRRLIDISPSGNKLPSNEYRRVISLIPFELGHIAYHCKEVYLKDPNAYDDYIPVTMLDASNDFYNFMADSYFVFKQDNGTTLKAAWDMYNEYCENAKVSFGYPQRIFKLELKNYFDEYKDRYYLENGTRVRSYYVGFKHDKFNFDKDDSDDSYIQNTVDTNRDSMGVDDVVNDDNLSFNPRHNIFNFDNSLELSEVVSSSFDILYSDMPAQYVYIDEQGSSRPYRSWKNCVTKLSDIDTSKLHYVKVPLSHIVIDFDLKNESGEKDLALNVAAAEKWPPTYAEVSKSGNGIHLHYIYEGDVSRLARLYDTNIEIKVYTGDSALRRKLTLCNNRDIASINSGLPLKEVNEMINVEGVKTEKILRAIISKALRKEVHPSTKSNIDFIDYILKESIKSGLEFDVRDMHQAILNFAKHSTNNQEYCIKLVSNMIFMNITSDNILEPGLEATMNTLEYSKNSEIIFFDCEVFPNLFVICWKLPGKDNKCVRMINPSKDDVVTLFNHKLIGFNCRKYDNHILYARSMGYTLLQLYSLSSRIISTKKDSNKQLFANAFNISYTDIYDFASAGNKQSLKKWEIQLGIHHHELNIPWDKPVPKELWSVVADYCCDDVIATEATFYHLKGDWIARQILADISGGTVNDTTNSLSTRIIFGNNRHPQNQFNYRDLSKPVPYTEYENLKIKMGEDYVFRIFDGEGLPLYKTYSGEELPEGYSIMPFFPGYVFDKYKATGKSTYLGEVIGEGGKVYSEPGIYSNVLDEDVTGQHPSSLIAEVLLGPIYTKKFKSIVDGRVAIKHQSWEGIDTLFDGKLIPYVEKVKKGELTPKELANALKTVVNSVYGLTAASFENPFRDERNVDNIVAKRGALFMTMLKQEVQKRGFQVAHIKTDSIKIPNATPEIQEFVVNFAKEFGYSFEVEAIFKKFCLINDAVYIALNDDDSWTAVGKQFAVPYVFKTLFSKEPIDLKDLAVTFSVTTSLFLDHNESLEEGEHEYNFVGRVGSFCPVIPGSGGGVLLRQGVDKNGDIKYDAASGSKGYRWLEYETILESHREDIVDMSYFEKLVNDAIEVISETGDYDWFMNK